MKWLTVGVAALALTGCDRLAIRQGEPGPKPAPAAQEPAIADLGQYVGRTYAEFVDDHEARFNPQALGLAASDRARLWRSMAWSSSAMLRGGGAQALVFRGCAASGCPDGSGVVAIEGHSGAVFAAVRDAGGAHVLVANERLEALVRLNAPTRDWADVALEPAPGPPPTPTPAREGP